MLKETNTQKVQVDFKSSGLAKRPGLQVFLRHLSSSVSSLLTSVQTSLLTPASVLSGRESFQILAESNLVLHCHSTGGRAMGGSAGHQPALLLFQPPGSWRRRSLQGATQRCVPRRLTNSLGSANVHSWVTSLPVPGSSVDFDGVFPQFQELEKLVFRPLLQGHQGPRFLLQILVEGQNDLGSLLGFLVPRVFEEPLEGFLVDVFKDVAHGLLA